MIYWARCGHHGLDQTLQALIVLPSSHRLTHRKLAPSKTKGNCRDTFLVQIFSTRIVNLRKIANVQKLIRSGHQTYIHMKEFFSLRIRENKKLYHEFIQISTLAPPSLCAWTPACLLTLLQIQPPLMSHCCIMRPHEMPEIFQNCSLCNCLAVR